MATFNLGRVKGSMWYTGTSDSNSAIATELTQAGITPLAYDMYLNSSNGNAYQYKMVSSDLTWVLIGNLKGAAGTGFSISKTYASVAAMNAGYATDGLPEGAFVLIETGNVDDADNAKLYVKGAEAYSYLTDLSGAQGIQGETGETGPQGPKGDPGTGISNVTIAEGTVAADGGQNYTMTLTKTDNTTVQLTFKAPKGNAGTDGAPGAAATVTVGSVTTGQPGTEAVVTNGGTSAAAVLNFTIPRGATGAKGDPGEKGDPGQTGANGKTPTMSINSNGELIATFED